LAPYTDPAGHRVSGWIFFIADEDDELLYKPATGSYSQIFADRSTEERRHFVMGLEHGIRTRYWPGGRLRARSFIAGVRFNEL
jgi:hypothetical protein